MNHTICYTSKVKNKLDAAALESIFDTTKENNTKNGITGILLFGMGTFFQVLEGEEDKVMHLYEEVIKKDSRHHEIFEIINRSSEEPVFSKYSTPFKIIKTSEELHKVTSYLSKNRIDPTSNKYRRLLNPFLLFV